MPWTGTDLDTLEGVFVEAIRQIVPRHQRAADESWKPYQRDKPSSIGTRWFRLEWDTVGFTPGGYFGDRLVDTTVTLSIVVDYGSMPEVVAKRVIEDDFYELHDVINALRPTTAGFIFFDTVDWIETADSKPDQVQAILQFSLRYMKRRA